MIALCRESYQFRGFPDWGDLPRLVSYEVLVNSSLGKTSND